MINETTIIIAVILVILTFTIPKKHFLLPFIIAACFIPTDQRIIIMSLDFTVLRILVLAGIARITLTGEQTPIRLNNFDYMIFAWVLCGAIVYSIQWMTFNAVINRAGFMFDAIGLYWLFRQQIRTMDDIASAVKILAICAITLAPIVAIEWITGRNPFVFLGTAVTKIRLSRYRCQAAFPHAIIMGLFWATMVPMFIGFARTQKNKTIYTLAIAASIFIVAASGSSTPAITLLLVLTLLFAFRWRRYVRQLSLYMIIVLAILHLIMEAPVWHLISRINIIGGSTGWHRYYLIDKAVEHFPQWAILGCRSTASWGMGLEDVTNQFILEGVRGGLITLALFITMLCLALNIPLTLSMKPISHKEQFLTWCLFVTILGHCISFFGVSYFGQITMLLYLMLAIVGLLGATANARITIPSYQHVLN